VTCGKPLEVKAGLPKRKNPVLAEIKMHDQNETERDIDKLHSVSRI